MKTFMILTIACSFSLFFFITGLTALSNSDIYISSNVIPQGDLCLIRIKVDKDEIPVVNWKDKQIHLRPSLDNTTWQGFLTADLAEEPGFYTACIKTAHSGKVYGFQIEVVSKDYGIRRLTLPKKMVDPDTETLKRIKKESEKMAALWENSDPHPLWNGPFLRPVPDKVIGLFGRKSYINDQLRAPHSGIDMRGKMGSPVKTVNFGKVVLTENHFFTGNSIVIDHGGGILSMYFHLDKIKVKTGDIVEKGLVIGLIGSTGRVTGPHLHFGMRINGARIDPLRLIDISQGLEE